MDMSNRVPGWVTPLAAVYIALALLSAAAIALDFYGRRRRLSSVAAEVVWVSSALYLGPFALLAYRRLDPREPRTTQGAGPAAVAGLPGGGASAIAHLIGVPLVVASGLTIAGIDLWVMIIVIGVLAIALLFVYERTAGTGHRRLSVATALGAAVLTVLAFDVGMGGWMLLLHVNSYMPPATDLSFWFLMQLGVVVGLVTGYPVVRWLAAQHRTAVPA